MEDTTQEPMEPRVETPAASTSEDGTAPPDFDELGGAPGAAGVTGEGASLNALYDLFLPVSIELGRTRLAVREILSLGRGSVVELERLAGEPVDVYVADRRFAKGEVVVLGEQFGVRITRILAPPMGAEGSLQ